MRKLREFQLKDKESYGAGGSRFGYDFIAETQSPRRDGEDI